MLERIKKIKLRYWTYALFALIFFFLFLFDFKSMGDHNLKTYILYAFVFIFIVSIIFAVMIKFSKIKPDNYYKPYFVFVLIIGLALIALSPPFTSSDEQSHFYRAYEITDGHFVTKADSEGKLSKLPSSLYKTYAGSEDVKAFRNASIKYSDIDSMLNVPLEKNDKIVYGRGYATDYKGAALYSPLQYLPHSVGIIIGKILNLGPFFLLMFGRLFNLIAYAFMTAFGLKILPKNKLFAMLVLLSPVMLIGASTFSADGFTYASIFLFIAYILKFMNTKENITGKNVCVLSALILFISLCKIVYLPIIFLVLLIPRECFKNNKNSILFKSLSIAFGLIIGALWFGIASSSLESASDASSKQITFMLTHLIDYVFITMRTYFENITIYAENLFFGEQLYHSQLKVYSLFSIAYLVIIFMALFNEKTKMIITNKIKIWIGILIFVIMILIGAALYVQYTSEWASIGNLFITGIQGRYLLPICFLLIFIVNCKRKFVDDQLLIDLILLLWIPTVLTIFTQFV